MDIFDEIDEVAKDLPRLKKVAKQVSGKKNNYQIVSYIIMGISIVLGLLFGNLFPACGSVSGFYFEECSSTEFNFSLTILIWFIGFLVSIFYYGMGEVISLLRSINDKLEKRK